MHFTYPPRKNSNPPPFRPRSSQFPTFRRSRPRALLLLLVTAIVGLWLLLRSRGPEVYHEHVPKGNPPVVILTVVDSTLYSETFLKSIRENREDYAARHGYKTMLVEASDYDTKGAPRSWTKVIAMRHALTLYPDAKFVWFLHQTAYIMDLGTSLEEQVTNPARLESLMIRDAPVVPPDSIIKTFSHLKGSDAALIISQDDSGLVINSMILRNGDWAKFFTEAWMDPLYQSYNFQKIERHTLEHAVQWHPTILSKLALIPQRTFASYGGNKEVNSYRDGDFVALMVNCPPTGELSCETQAQYYRQQLQTKYGQA